MAAMQSPCGPSPRGPAHAVGFLRLSLVTLTLLWLIIPSGAIVRLTSSGLGCPDWPLCDGGVVPASAGHQLIEYTNRLRLRASC